MDLVLPTAQSPSPTLCTPERRRRKFEIEWHSRPSWTWTCLFFIICRYPWKLIPEIFEQTASFWLFVCLFHNPFSCEHSKLYWRWPCCGRKRYIVCSNTTTLPTSESNLSLPQPSYILIMFGYSSLLCNPYTFSGNRVSACSHRQHLLSDISSN